MKLANENHVTHSAAGHVTHNAEGDPRSRGWGRTRYFPATGSSGEELVLSTRAPADWHVIDVMKMPADVVRRNGSLAQVVATLARGIDAAKVIAILGLGRE